MANLKYLGLTRLAHELLTAGGVRNLGNQLSLLSGIHAKFDNLDPWFEGTDGGGTNLMCAQLTHCTFVQMMMSIISTHVWLS